MTRPMIACPQLPDVVRWALTEWTLESRKFSIGVSNFWPRSARSVTDLMNDTSISHVRFQFWEPKAVTFEAVRRELYENIIIESVEISPDDGGLSSFTIHTSRAGKIVIVATDPVSMPF
jgi:hypothetical protein